MQDVNLEVGRGEILGLLGESGSGKSTLLRIAAGLLDADQGAVLLNRKPIAPARDRLIPGHAAIKMVHQEYNLSLVLTVQENIAYALRFYEKSYQKSRIKELLALCQLEAVAHQTIKTLSGGEKQRTAIAQALAEQAQVLLLDEPFAHLDLPNRQRLSDTIRKLVAQTGIACLFVTHDPVEALGLSKRLGVLQNGQIVQCDTPQMVYQQPISGYVAELTGEANLLEIAFWKRYFGNSVAHFLEDGRVLLRPEQLGLSADIQADSFVQKARVEACIFRGMYYEIHLKMGKQWLVAYSASPFLQKQEVAVSTQLGKTTIAPTL